VIFYSLETDYAPSSIWLVYLHAVHPKLVDMPVYNEKNKAFPSDCK